jgi:hypothetical protein
MNFGYLLVEYFLGGLLLINLRIILFSPSLIVLLLNYRIVILINAFVLVIYGLEVIGFVVTLVLVGRLAVYYLMVIITLRNYDFQKKNIIVVTSIKLRIVNLIGLVLGNLFSKFFSRYCFISYQNNFINQLVLDSSIYNYYFRNFVFRCVFLFLTLLRLRFLVEKVNDN